MFVKTKIIAQTKRIYGNFSREKINSIKEIYTNSYAQIVKEYEAVLISYDQEKFSTIIQKHNQLVVDTAKKILATYEIPADFPLFGFFSGSFGHEKNMLNSDYDVNFIYEDNYYKWFYPIEKRFIKDLAFVTNNKPTTRNFHNIIIRVAYRYMLQKSSWTSLANQPFFLKNSIIKIKSKLLSPTILNKAFEIIRKTKNKSMRKILETFINVFLYMTDDKPVFQNSKMVNEYISHFIFEPWVSGISPLIGDKNLYSFTEKNLSKSSIIRRIQLLKEEMLINYKKICDSQTYEYEVKHKSINLSLRFLNMLRILHRIDIPVTLGSLTNDPNIKSIIGAENYAYLSNLIYEFLCLKMAFDHETEFIKKNYYLIKNNIIERLHTTYNYPVKTIEDFDNYIKAKQKELYKVISEIIERLYPIQKP